MTDTEHPWRDGSLLRELYWEQELSTTEIADKLGCTQQTVSRWMQRLDIPRRDPREAAPNRRRRRALRRWTAVTDAPRELANRLPPGPAGLLAR